MISIIFENCIENPANVLNDNSARLYLVDHSERGWEEITLVHGTELLSRFRERRTGQTCRYNVYSPKLSRREVIEIFLSHVPLRPVKS